MGITQGTSAETPDAEPRTGGEAIAGSPNAELDAVSRPRIKTGLTGTRAMATPGTPARSDGAVGLHAPPPTPGPVVQQFVTLGRYQLLSRLAVGGMAEVYLARQGELSGFKTLVVVKRVLPHLAVKPDFIAMFLDEARIASMLDHPNVVRILEVGRTDSEYFLAMELVQGKSLAAVLQQSERARTALPHALGALIVANAAAGLHHAHELADAAGQPLGLVHRDVSPQNIMVSFEGSVKVIDFGIARALGRLGDTNSGSLKGKLGYMAPEQARAEAVDARADIFSLGVVLWECIAGRRLFLRENELATLRAVVHEPIPKVSRYTKVDPVLEVIIEHALARELDERFQTAAEMRVALERWVFAAGGSSTHDLATMMKAWFPGDHLQWQRAARLALDMQESDPPIDAAFPALASSRSSISRPGSRSGSGSGNRPLLDRSPVSQQIMPLPALAAPEPQAGRWRGVATFLLALVLIAGGAVGYYFYSKPNSPVVPVAPITQPAHKVEIVPVAAAGGDIPTKPVGASPALQVTPTEAGAQAQARPTEDATPGKKRKRGLVRRDDDGSSTKRPNPFDKSAGKMPTDLRPNPF